MARELNRGVMLQPDCMLAGYLPSKSLTDAAQPGWDSAPGAPALAAKRQRPFISSLIRTAAGVMEV